jgi:tripartite-type tricarboxylate transporter receptor subunit TctC
VPTFKELGRDDVVCVRVRGCYVAPPGTPKEVVEILEKAMGRAVADPESAKVFENSGITIDFQSSNDLGKSIGEDYNLLGIYKDFIK